MDKTIIVAFENNEQRKEKKGLAQWDKGMTLKVYGLETTDKVQVHFSLNNICGDAKAVEATIENDAIVAKIPQFILEGPTGIRYQRTYNAYAFIYLYDEDSAETVKRIIFEVETRPKPVDYVHSEEELKEWTKLEQKIKNQSTQFENEQKKQDDVISEKISRPASAKVGHMLVVEAVDEDGKPAEWKVIAPPECKVKSVNGNQPDENGNISIETSGVKTVNGTAPDENGNIEIEAGGASSWNELEGRPFYEEGEILAIVENVVFENGQGQIDGQIEIGKTYSIELNGISYTSLCADNGEGMAMCVPNGTDLTGEVPPAFILMQTPAGLVFMNPTSTGNDVVSVYCDNRTIKKLDNKFIDAEWMAKEEVTTNKIEWDGDTANKESIPYSETGGYYKISDTPISVENCIGGEIVIFRPNVVEGNEIYVNITEDKITDNSSTGVPSFSIDSGSMGIMVFTEDVSLEGMNFTKGIYFGFDSDYGYVKSLNCTTTTATPLPEKFLPKEAIKAIAEEVILGGEW